MSNYFLQLSGGSTPGPFDVYLSGSSGETLYLANVSKGQLQAGISVTVPNDVPSSSIVVYNISYGCSNEVQIIIPTPFPSLTPASSVEPTITPTPSISPTATPSLTPTPSITPTKTPTPSVEATITPSITPSLSSGGPTPTPTITRTPSITPSTSPSVTLYTYTGCGYGSSISNACNDASNNRTLYSDCDSGAFGVGCGVLVDLAGNPLTGYPYVFMNGAVWDVDTVTGLVLAYSNPQC